MDKVYYDPIEHKETMSGTRLTHKETFSGLLAPIFCGQRKKVPPPPLSLPQKMLNSMNNAVKAFAEEWLQ